MAANILCESLIENMGQARIICYQTTGNKTLASIKYALTYILFYIPEMIFLTIFFPAATLLLGNLNQPRYFLITVDILSKFNKIVKWPCKTILGHYLSRTGSYENTIDKMWRNPLVPYDVVLKYIEHNGHPCPSPK